VTDDVTLAQKIKIVTPKFSRPHIFVTVPGRRIGRLQKTPHSQSNGHVTDKVT